MKKNDANLFAAIVKGGGGNPNHDENGRFTSGGGGGSKGGGGGGKEKAYTFTNSGELQEYDPSAQATVTPRPSHAESTHETADPVGKTGGGAKVYGPKHSANQAILSGKSPREAFPKYTMTDHFHAAEVHEKLDGGGGAGGGTSEHAALAEAHRTAANKWMMHAIRGYNSPFGSVGQ